MDDEPTPLYGETSRRTKIFLYIVAFIVGAFAIESLIAAIVQGIKTVEHENILLMVTVIFLAVLVIILLVWYRRGNLDPKFKGYLAFLIICYMFFLITVNVIVFTPLPSASCQAQGKLWNPNNGQCYPDCSQTAGHCMCFTSNPPQCYDCSQNATSICP